MDHMDKMGMIIPKTFVWIRRKSLILSQELGDRAVEAQACYSLGNTYTLLRNYAKAIEYHLKHLQIAQQLHDKVGEGMIRSKYFIPQVPEFPEPSRIWKVSRRFQVELSGVWGMPTLQWPITVKHFCMPNNI